MVKCSPLDNLGEDYLLCNSSSFSEDLKKFKMKTQFKNIITKLKVAQALLPSPQQVSQSPQNEIQSPSQPTTGGP